MAVSSGENVVVHAENRFEEHGRQIPIRPGSLRDTVIDARDIFRNKRSLDRHKEALFDALGPLYYSELFDEMNDGERYGVVLNAYLSRFKTPTEEQMTKAYAYSEYLDTGNPLDQISRNFDGIDPKKINRLKREMGHYLFDYLSGDRQEGQEADPALLAPSGMVHFDKQPQLYT